MSLDELRRDEALLRMAEPMRALALPSAEIEAQVETPLTAADHDALAKACTASGQPLGVFYHWHYQKWLIARRVKALDREGIEVAIDRYDETDYAPLDRALERPGGLLVAVPHHGPFILSNIAVTRYLARKGRRVLVFYASPNTNAGNAVFDHLYDVMFGDASSGIEVIHDTRAGMVKAIRGLQSGAAVLIMPDVFKNEDDTYQVPFCGQPFNVMLGTGTLARKTNSSVLPLVSHPLGAGMGFRCRFGPLLETRPCSDDVGDLREDYAILARTFAFYESVMRDEILYWQYVRQFYMDGGHFATLDRKCIGEAVELSLKNAANAIRLDHLVDLGAEDAAA